MSNRSKKIINKKFQLRTALKIMSIIIMSYFAFISLTGTHAIRKQKEISKTVEELQKAVVVEDNIIRAFIDYSRENMDIESEEILALKKIKKDHRESIGTINEYMELLQNYNRELIYILIAVTVIMILLSFFSFFYIIRLTHRISGPLNVIEQHIDDLLKGEKPELRDLRKKDEFKDFYDKFRTMAGRIREKE